MPSITRTPRVSNACRMTVEIASSSRARMRGAASSSVTSAPNAEKIEASCAPVAEAPTIATDFGRPGSDQTSWWVWACSLPGKSNRRACPPTARMNRPRQTPPVSHSIVCGSTNAAPPLLSMTFTPDSRRWPISCFFRGPDTQPAACAPGAARNPLLAARLQAVGRKIFGVAMRRAAFARRGRHAAVVGHVPPSLPRSIM